MQIRDLPRPITAAKSHWVPGGSYLAFTPADTSPNGRTACESAVNRQAGNGYILDYVTHAIDEPNEGFENSPEYLHDREQHAPVAGKVIAVHRLRSDSGRSLREIIGDADFERLQDMWARGGNRIRWSVAFPVIESYDIENPPNGLTFLGLRLIGGYLRILRGFCVR